MDPQYPSEDEQVTDFEIERGNLFQKVKALEKVLDRQKQFHRKFADDVIVSESIRNEDFAKEKRDLVEQNKELRKENRQLKKDVSFYKGAFEEVLKEDESAGQRKPDQIRDKNSSLEYIATTSTGSTVSASVSSFLPEFESDVRVSSCTASQTDSVRSLRIKSKPHSSRVVSKIAEQLLLENKKLKAKVAGLNTTVGVLKRKNKQLENFQTKVENKEIGHSKELLELEALVASTKKTNKDIFNTKALAKLEQLAENVKF